MSYQIKQSIILTGDLNSDLFTSHNNKLIDTMNLFNLTNIIEKPTRVTEHNSTLFDPIIISDSIHYSFSGVLKIPSDISDHGASIICIDGPMLQTRSFRREVCYANEMTMKMCNTFTETFLRVARECNSNQNGHCT
jgi:hypothetical protein